MEEKTKELVLIDAYGFLFRSYYSLPPISRKDGLATGGLYGFCSMLLKLLEKHQSAYMAIVLDSGRKTFRNDIYEAYKANRPDAPDDLKQQFPFLKNIAESFSIKAVEAIGYEADDIIATLSKQAEKLGFTVKIISSDKDLMQLINASIHLYDSLKEKDITEGDVQEKFGVAPSKVLDVLSLMGDSSDNIPGVKGIGPKTASGLINEFESLDGIYEKIENVKNERIKNLLITEKENAFLSKKLATLHENVPLEIDVNSLLISNIYSEKLISFFREMEFKSLISRIASKYESIGEPKHKHQIKITKFENSIQTNSILEKIKQADNCYFLVNNFGKAYFFSSNQALEIENNIQSNLFEKSDNNQQVIEKILNDDSIFLAVYNKPEIAKKFTINLSSGVDDIKLMLYLLNGVQKEDASELLFLQKQSLTEDDLGQFIDLYQQLKLKLCESKLLGVYLELDKPLSKVLIKMQNFGIKVDALYLKNLGNEFESEINQLSNSIYKKAGKTFNVASNKQLAEVLYEDLKIVEGKKNKAGNYSVDSEILEQLSLKGNDIADDILHFRELSKLKNTYVEGLLTAINNKTGKVHSTFDATGTLTGRLSSHNPNLQNIPIKTQVGRKIRKAFVADAGKVFLSADYSQIELRILAHIAKIPSLIKAFKENKDIHKITAMQVFGLKENEVTDDFRRKAKTINFGIIYGQSAYGLSQQLKIEVGQAKNYIDKYFIEYPGIKQYMESTIDFARKNGYVQTLWGRKCYIKNINTKDFFVKSLAERSSINAPIQGTASDIMKKVMVSLDYVLKKQSINANLVLQIHDELVFEVDEPHLQKAIKIIKQEMEKALVLNVPLTVNISHAQNLEDI